MQFKDLKAALSGEWEGTDQLYLEPPPAAAAVSASRLSVRAVAGESFLQFSYDWAFDGEAQSGVLLLGCDEENAASVAWGDSFHMSKKIMFCTGSVAEGAVDVRGSYAAPPGPDWGWRITIRSVTPDELQIVMHNISPEGEEDLAVQADYRRAS